MNGVTSSTAVLPPRVAPSVISGRDSAGLCTFGWHAIGGGAESGVRRIADISPIGAA